MTVDAMIPRDLGPFLPAPLLAASAARTEAERCLYCHDAPCAHACPTGIDVASFIRKIATGNLEGSARTILAANPLGATCGAACPVERLCEGACVRNDLDRPIEIGRLQRYAVETAAAMAIPAAPAVVETGKSVAIVGAGPAGLACAAELRRAGVAVTVYDKSERAGGLGDHGIVPWRLSRETVAVDVAAIERAGAKIVLGRPSAGTWRPPPCSGITMRWSWPSASATASTSASQARSSGASSTRSTSLAGPSTRARQTSRSVAVSGSSVAAARPSTRRPRPSASGPKR